MDLQSEAIKAGGSSATSGAATGAAIGSIVPGIGTAIGGVIGAIGGFFGDLFGGPKKVDDPRDAFIEQNAPQYYKSMKEETWQQSQSGNAAKAEQTKQFYYDLAGGKKSETVSSPSPNLNDAANLLKSISDLASPSAQRAPAAVKSSADMPAVVMSKSGADYATNNFSQPSQVSILKSPVAMIAIGGAVLVGAYFIMKGKK